ncbi:CC/Se motif family (seleno)protein [Ureibacillus thermophilus]|uniref:CC/Se motif family (seleno)protein n=1 Tax=Ureibacillus thermophilus TaxID=367743 RepID=UPI00361FB47E
MHIKMDEEVKKRIRSKGNQLTVQLLEVQGCCAPTVQELVVSSFKPKKMQQYQEFIVEDISVYVQKPLLMNEKLTLQMKGFGLFKTISAKVQ